MYISLPSNRRANHVPDHSLSYGTDNLRYQGDIVARLVGRTDVMGLEFSL